jgi:hypothetical protein
MLRIPVDGRTLPVSLLLPECTGSKGLFCIYLDSLSGLFGMDEAIAG